MVGAESKIPNGWSAWGGFLAINGVATVGSIFLAHLFVTPSIMVVNAIPIILCGWLYGRSRSFYAALFLFAIPSVYFKFAGLEMYVDPKGLFLGTISYGIFSGAGYALRSVRDLYLKIHRLNEEINTKNRELREASLRDPLTELHNRRYVDEFIAHLAATFLQQISTPEFALRKLDLEDKVMLMMIADIDHFKLINDKHGHSGGDQALVEVARRIRSAVRFDDTVIRWGGEEFLVVCPMVDHTNAEQVIRKILEGVRSAPVVLADGSEVMITISVGAIWLPVLRGHPYAVSFDKSIMLADKALYDAKEHGRNHGRMVVAWEDGRAATEGALIGALEEFYRDPSACMVTKVY
ncbi:MAG: GGDEF domain-containing protein [Fibrobacterota bacterium]|nr:GGDEF domain-containing protein [Fibrobacterota bacterium]QQS03915.1 MAG: GGDEF domain-containing protein [Fibrobacterota bacterium]